VQYIVLTAFTVPAIIYIDRWGRRPMLLIGTALMGIFLYLVGGLQAGYGFWSDPDGTGVPVWTIPPNHQDVTIGVIVCSYLFVAS
jgi:MFS family permease